MTAYDFASPRNDGFIRLLKARALLYRACNELNERRKP
jgi:hypothetical protein